MIPGTLVAVEYDDCDGETKTFTGTWHVNNLTSGSRGPLLVGNPAAWDMDHACCWSIPWDSVKTLTRVFTDHEVLVKALTPRLLAGDDPVTTAEHVIAALNVAGYTITKNA